MILSKSNCCTSPLMQSFPAGIVTRETSGFLVFLQILQEDRTTGLTVISKLPRLQKKIDLVLLYHCSASLPKPFEEKQQDLNPARQPQQHHSRSGWSNVAPNIRPKSCGQWDFHRWKLRKIARFYSLRLQMPTTTWRDTYIEYYSSLVIHVS